MEEKRRKEAEDRGEDPDGAQPDAAGQAKEPAAPGDGEAGPSAAGGGDDEKE